MLSFVAYPIYGTITPPMAWTEEKTEQLKKLWAEGHTASQISKMLGDGISRNAVIGKSHRLGLQGRAQSRMISAPRINNRVINENNAPTLLKLHGSTNWLTTHPIYDGKGGMKLNQITPPDSVYVYESTVQPFPCWNDADG